MGKYNHCPCCGIASSAADRARSQMDSILDGWKESAVAAKDSRALARMAKLHMDRVSVETYQPDDPGALASEDYRRHIKNAIERLEDCLESEASRDKETNK